MENANLEIAVNVETPSFVRLTRGRRYMRIDGRHISEANPRNASFHELPQRTRARRKNDPNNPPPPPKRKRKRCPNINLISDVPEAHVLSNAEIVTWYPEIAIKEENVTAANEPNAQNGEAIQPPEIGSDAVPNMLNAFVEVATPPPEICAYQQLENNAKPNSLAARVNTPSPEMFSDGQLECNAVPNSMAAITSNDVAEVATSPPEISSNELLLGNNAIQQCRNSLTAVERSDVADVATPPPEVCADQHLENNAKLNSLAAIESNGVARVNKPSPGMFSDGQLECNAVHNSMATITSNDVAGVTKSPSVISLERSAENGAASDISNIEVTSPLSVATANESLVKAVVAALAILVSSNASQNTAEERERVERRDSNFVTSTLIGNGNVDRPAFGSITLSDISSAPLTMSTDTALAMAEIEPLD